MRELKFDETENPMYVNVSDYVKRLTGTFNDLVITCEYFKTNGYKLSEINIHFNDVLSNGIHGGINGIPSFVSDAVVTSVSWTLRSGMLEIYARKEVEI